MQSYNLETTSFDVTPKTLPSMSSDVLIELLAHKTRLLIAATVARLPEKQYTQNLNAEVEAIQAEIKKRMNSSKADNHDPDNA